MSGFRKGGSGKQGCWWLVGKPEVDAEHEQNALRGITWRRQAPWMYTSA